MKLSLLIVAALPALGRATLTFNVTSARELGKFEYYRCWKTEKLLEKIPSCIHSAQNEANSKDGCDYDDFACHCINYQVFSDIIEPLVFPPSLGGTGNCSLEDLGKARPVISDMCNFFNATQYASYVGCGICTSPQLTLPIIWREHVVKSY
ncbi:hypothetical protein K431DRAFT_259611 [Polychaeton citri CBS 116435]|uniref:CFEM domain-containing protein n=1 Tax=Polychaeton citri CBS 116435 TaxID=1314669 RepID=A0A9P4UUJ7_9PEZI|nr:hypothetical protein K431DRAFT_259611 [Polychaeton citri CBS 116435]